MLTLYFICDEDTPDEPGDGPYYTEAVALDYCNSSGQVVVKHEIQSKSTVITPKPTY